MQTGMAVAQVVNVAVMGAGSWGTTLAKVFADAGNMVQLWARRDEPVSYTHLTLPTKA